MEMTHDNEVTQSDPEEAQSHRNCPFVFLRKRYMVAMLSFLGFANIYAMRVNLSVAIAVMVANQTVAQNGEEIQVLSNVCCPPIFLKLGIFLRIHRYWGFLRAYVSLQSIRFALHLTAIVYQLRLCLKGKKRCQQMFMFL